MTEKLSFEELKILRKIVDSGIVEEKDVGTAVALANRGLISANKEKYFLTDEGTKAKEIREKLEAELEEANKKFEKKTKTAAATKEKVEKLLKRKDLFEITIKETDKKIVGENLSRKVIWLCICGRLVENANLTSFNLIVNDETGTGKDWITTHIGELLPKEIFIKRTRISEKVFTYWHNPKFEPEWTWNGKCFYNEDITQSVMNSDVFKVMASTGSHATVIIEQRPIDIEINGKPVMIITTESATPNRENVRRFTILNLDTSIDQTQAIMKRQAELAEKGVATEYDPALLEALIKHKRVKVKIPFAVNLADRFPKQKVLMRTQFKRFLDWVAAATAFYQFQRKKDKNGFLLATKQDYDIAKECFEKITSNPFLIPLTKQQRKIVESFDVLGKGWHKIDDLVVANADISESWLRKQLDKLTEYGILEKDRDRADASDKLILIYQKKEIQEAKLPDFEELLKKDKSNNEISGKIE